MSYRNPQPDRSKAGAARDRLPTVADRALVAERALAADLADLATEATTASEAISVSPLSPRGTMNGTETLALISDGRIQPLALDDLYALLEARYGITPVP